MKRFGILICTLLFLAVQIFGASAEEAFFEEGFEVYGIGEESSFDEEAFGGEEFFVEDIPEDGEEWDVMAEERSVIEIPNEDVSAESSLPGWEAPQWVQAFSNKDNTVTLEWTHSRNKLEKGMNFYVYEVDEKGKGIQVGVTTKKKVTVKNVLGGEHKYFVRLEFVDPITEREQYGVRSTIKPVTVRSILWKKAPSVTATQTGQNEITLSWKADTGAAFYELEIQHGTTTQPWIPVKIPESGAVLTYIDADAVIGNNTYKIKAITRLGEEGKAGKKIVTLSNEPWKAAPVVIGFSQLTENKGRVHFTHVSAAEKYLVQVGKITSYPSFDNEMLKYDAETESYYADVGVHVSGKGKQKLTVMPMDASGKKGMKSAAYPVRILKQNLLGAVNLKAYADGFNVFVEWEAMNPEIQGFRAYLFNADQSVKEEGKVTKGKNEAYFENEVPAGTYTVFVRALRGGEGNEDPLYDTENMECQTVVVVDGVKLKDLEITLDKTKDKIVMDTPENESTTTIIATKTDTTRPVIWRSLDPTIATVDDNGVVTALKGGTARIAATAGYNTEICTIEIDGVTYRALLIGNNYTGYDYLAGPKYDIDRMETMLKGLKKTPYQVTKKHNLDSTDFRTAILQTFADADENDVSFFYYSGHGEEDTGSLCGHSDDGVVTPEQLRSYLDIIKGRKVVFSDSCFSGNLIGRGETSDKELSDLTSAETIEIDDDEGDSAVTAPVSRADFSTANQAFIDAFRPKLEGRSESDLADTEYYVITAASGSESSIDRSNWEERKNPSKLLKYWIPGKFFMADGKTAVDGRKTKLSKGTLYRIYTVRVRKGRYVYTMGGAYKVTKAFGTGAFTRSVLRGLGWDLNNKYSEITKSWMRADEDGDSKVTLSELYSFAYDDLFDFLGSGSHEAQVYPTNCDVVFFAN